MSLAYIIDGKKTQTKLTQQMTTLFIDLYKYSVR